nr:hypothetical protein [Micromonospora sp. DSM 115978]
MPVAANGSPAYWQLRPVPESGYRPFVLVLVDVADGLVTGLTTFLEADRLLPLLGPPGQS